MGQGKRALLAFGRRKGKVNKQVQDSSTIDKLHVGTVAPSQSR